MGIIDVDLKNPCDTTNLSFNPIVNNMLAYVDQAADTQTVLATDTASSTYGNLDGFTLCGPRSYTITSTAYSFLNLSVDTLTLSSTDPAEVGIYSVTIEACLVNYPAISPIDTTFNIEIRCQVLSLSWTTPLPATYVHTLLVDAIPDNIAF